MDYLNQYSDVIKKIALFFLIVLISISCKSENEEAISKEKYGGVFQLNISDPVTSLDPNQIIYVPDWEVASIIYEGLVGYGIDFDQIEPLIAESWILRDEEKEYIFKIRRGLKFHDDVCFKNGNGRTINAYDVQYSFQRICSAKNPSLNFGLYIYKIEGAKEFNEGKSAEIKGISVLDSFTVKIRLTRASASFLKILASQSAYIIPREAEEYYKDDFKHHPIGNGPFRLAKWKEMEEIILVKNEHYWKKDSTGSSLPFLEKIKITLGNSQEMIYNEFVKGNNYLFVVDAGVFNSLKQRGGFAEQFNFHKIEKGMSVRFFGFSMNKNTKLAKDKNLRKAIAASFNRSKVLENEINAVSAYSLVPSYLFKRKNIFSNPYNIEEAKLLAAQSDFPDKITISSPVKLNDVEELKENINSLGMRAVVNNDAVNYYNHILSDRPDIFRVSMHPSYPDAEEYYQLFILNPQMKLIFADIRINNMTGYLKKQLLKPIIKKERNYTLSWRV